MSQLNKTQLEAENQSSFPNNNFGAITPALLRGFNTDMIDSLVDEGQYNIDSSSVSSSIAMLEAQVDSLVLSGSGVVIQEEGTALGSATALNFVGASVTASLAGNVATINVNATDTDLSGLNQFSQSINTYTGSMNQFTQSINQYTASNNVFSASVASEIDVLQAEVDSLQAVTGSYLSTASFNSFSSSVANEVDVLQAEVDSLQAVTGSYATTSSLNTLSSSLSTRLTNDEGNISSNTNRIQSLESVTGSYATTGSNIFDGNQTIISGSELKTNAIRNAGPGEDIIIAFDSSANLRINTTNPTLEGVFIDGGLQVTQNVGITGSLSVFGEYAKYCQQLPTTLGCQYFNH